MVLYPDRIVFAAGTIRSFRYDYVVYSLRFVLTICTSIARSDEIVHTVDGGGGTKIVGHLNSLIVSVFVFPC
jgi:hypothetical protein